MFDILMFGYSKGSHGPLGGKITIVLTWQWERSSSSTLKEGTGEICFCGTLRRAQGAIRDCLSYPELPSLW